jgi:Fic family protein
VAKAVRSLWQPEFAGIGIPRRDRGACWYDAYVPDTLASREFTFEGTVAADVADAERAVHVLDSRAVALVDTEALARLLLRAESVASSRIEGLQISPRRLLRADAARDFGEPPSDVGAAEVLANIDAMTFAADGVRHGEPISVEMLLEIHRRLLEPTRLREHGGTIRTVQNWIGGSSYNPCTAAFVPPPPDTVEYLLDDLCAFCNTESMPAVAQAAIAHAQFETIHPFVDGNGRVGRTLIHMILRRRGLTRRVLPPISLVLATWADRYVAGLNATRYLGEASSAGAREGTNGWVALFATACQRSVEDASTFEERIQQIEVDWRSRLGTVRAKSATALLLEKLPGAPVVTVQSAAALIGRTAQAANEAVSRLVRAEILVQSRAGRRNRAFEARDVIDAFTDLERRLASPGGNTRVSPPARPVPYRPRGKKARTSE